MFSVTLHLRTCAPPVARVLAQSHFTEGARRRDNIGERAIVAAERQDLGAGVILVKLSDIGGGCTAKAIDSLILIAHHPDIGPLASQQLEQHTAGTVHVLKFIDQYLLVALAEFGQRANI